LNIDKEDLKNGKEEIVKEVIEEIDDTNSTIISLSNFAQLMFFIKQDQLSLLYVHHEDDVNAVSGLREFKKTERKLRGYAHFLILPCHDESFQTEQTPMCNKEPNSGIFPLISSFVPPTTRLNPYTKEVEDNREVPFSGGSKTERSISKFLTSNLPNFVTPITKSKEYDSLTSSSKKINKAVLFSEKSISPVLYKALASKFKDRLDFYFVDATKLGKKVKKLGIDTYPTIIVYVSVDNDGEKVEEHKTVTYKGGNEIHELYEFMNQYALVDKFDPNSVGKPQYQKRGPYTLVNHKNYTRGLMEDYRAQVVFFDKSYANVKEKFENVAEELHGPANIVFFDCSSEQAQRLVEEKFEVKKFPKIMVWSTGTVKKHSTALEISISNDAENIINLVSETEIKDKLKEVSDTMLSSIIVNNAVQLGKMTIAYLYEGDDHEVPLSYKSMSSNPIFEDKVEFLALKSPNKMTLQQFHVPKLPVLIGGVPPSSDFDRNDPESQGEVRTMLFQGDIEDYFQLLEYNLGILQTFFPNSIEEEKEVERTSEATTEFEEITSDNFDEICESKRGFCVIGFLNDYLDTNSDLISHLNHLQILEERNTESSSQFKYMWINGTCHSYLLEDFELSSMYLPSVVIYSPSQKKYSRMVTTFTKENLIDFEKSFEGSGKNRIIVNDAPEDLSAKIQELDCPSIASEVPEFSEENMLDKEMEEEIMREILEEERRKREELEEVEEENPKVKKKGKGKKKKAKKN
jgi:hypothetical protein